MPPGRIIRPGDKNECVRTTQMCPSVSFTLLAPQVDLVPQRFHIYRSTDSINTARLGCKIGRARGVTGFSPLAPLHTLSLLYRCHVSCHCCNKRARDGRFGRRFHSSTAASVRIASVRVCVGWHCVTHHERRRLQQGQSASRPAAAGAFMHG